MEDASFPSEYFATDDKLSVLSNAAACFLQIAIQGRYIITRKLSGS